MIMYLQSKLRVSRDKICNIFLLTFPKHLTQSRGKRLVKGLEIVKVGLTVQGKEMYSNTYYRGVASALCFLAYIQRMSVVSLTTPARQGREHLLCNDDVNHKNTKILVLRPSGRQFKLLFKFGDTKLEIVIKYTRLWTINTFSRQAWLQTAPQQSM